MAKCVACTALNQSVEAQKHPGFSAESMARILQRRWNDVSKRDKRRYCALHNSNGEGRATGGFVPLAKKAEEEREERKAMHDTPEQQPPEPKPTPQPAPGPTPDDAAPGGNPGSGGH